MRTKPSSYPTHAPAQAARLKAGRPSSLVDTGVIYCGDCLEHLRKHPGTWVDGEQGKIGGQKDTLEGHIPVLNRAIWSRTRGQNVAQPQMLRALPALGASVL